MKTVLKCAAIAGALVLTAGSAAWAQNDYNNGGYGANPGTNMQANPTGYQNQGLTSDNDGYPYNHNENGSGNYGYQAYNRYSSDTGRTAGATNPHLYKYRNGYGIYLPAQNSTTALGGQGTADQGNWGSNAYNGTWGQGRYQTYNPNGNNLGNVGYGSTAGASNGYGSNAYNQGYVGNNGYGAYRGTYNAYGTNAYTNSYGPGAANGYGSSAPSGYYGSSAAGTSYPARGY